jgi:hypothetical protein
VLLRQASQRKARLDTESVKLNEQNGAIQTTIQEVCINLYMYLPLYGEFVRAASCCCCSTCESLRLLVYPTCPTSGL